MSDNPDFGGYADTSFGKDNSNEAKGFDAGLANEIASGGYASPAGVPSDEDINNEDKSGYAPLGNPLEGRSLIERAAGWLGDKVQGKINNALENPAATAINIGAGFVPGLGLANSISNMFGGPTLGSIVTGAAQSIRDGTGVPVGPDVLPGFTGDTVGDQDWYAGQMRYYRLRDGTITSRLVKADGSIQAVEEGFKAAV